MIVSRKVKCCGLLFLTLILVITLLRNQADKFNCYFNESELKFYNSTCCHKISEAQKYLEAENIIFSCEALEVKSCEKTHQR